MLKKESAYTPPRNSKECYADSSFYYYINLWHDSTYILMTATSFTLIQFCTIQWNTLELIQRFHLHMKKHQYNLHKSRDQ